MTYLLWTITSSLLVLLLLLFIFCFVEKISNFLWTQTVWVAHFFCFFFVHSFIYLKISFTSVLHEPFVPSEEKLKENARLHFFHSLSLLIHSFSIPALSVLGLVMVSVYCVLFQIGCCTTFIHSARCTLACTNWFRQFFLSCCPCSLLSSSNSATLFRFSFLFLHFFSSLSLSANLFA